MEKSQGKPRLPLVVSPSNRDETTAKDAKLINGYVEKDNQDTWWVYKRPGLNVYLGDSTSSPPAPGSRLAPNVGPALGFGTYNWNNDIYSVWVVGGVGKFYKNNQLIGTVDVPGGPYVFIQILGQTPKIFFKNTAAAYNYDDLNGLIRITSANYPTTTVPGAAYLDGTAYVMTPAAAIKGTNINDTLTWDPLNSLIAQVEPDGGVYLGKQLAYVIAFKQWSTEVFYDASQPAGSPLGPVQGAKVSQGCRAFGSVAELAGVLYWISQSKGSVGVHRMELLKAEPIEYPPIERLLQNADFSTTWAFAFKLDGHTFYLVTIKNANLTLVYDATSRTWAQWTDPNGNYFPFVSCTYNSVQDVILQHESNGQLYSLDNNNLTDAGSLIVVDIYTPEFDGNMRTRKFLNRIDFIGDQIDGCILQIRHNDNNYAPDKWSNFRSVDMRKKRPFIMNEGTFHKRAYHIRHAGTTSLRLQALELDILPGTL